MNPKTEYSRTNNDCQTIYRYNPDENLWAELGKLPEPRSHCGAVLLRNQIYIFGEEITANQPKLPVKIVIWLERY